MISISCINPTFWNIFLNLGKQKQGVFHSILSFKESVKSQPNWIITDSHQHQRNWIIWCYTQHQRNWIIWCYTGTTICDSVKGTVMAKYRVNIWARPYPSCQPTSSQLYNDEWDKMQHFCKAILEANLHSFVLSLFLCFQYYHFNLSLLFG